VLAERIASTCKQGFFIAKMQNIIITGFRRLLRPCDTGELHLKLHQSSI